MKKLNLSIYLFAAYSLLSNGTILKEDGTSIVADKNGKVKLVCSADGTFNGKEAKAGSVITMKLADIVSWSEDEPAEAWEVIEETAPSSEATSTPASATPETSVAKKAKKEKTPAQKTLLAMEKELTTLTNTMIDTMGSEGWDANVAAVKAQKDAIEKFIADNPDMKGKVGRKSNKVEVVFTEEQKKAIALYEEKITGLAAARKLVESAKAEVETAKNALPEGYKAKRTQSTSGTNGGPKPPKITAEIRAAMLADKNAGMATKGLKEKYGYSGAYTALCLKKAAAEATPTAPEAAPTA